MHVGGYLGLLHENERELAAAFTLVASRHPKEAAVTAICPLLAAWSSEHAQRLAPFLDRYGEQHVPTAALRSVLFQGSPLGGRGLLRDLQDLSALVGEVHLLWVMLSLTARALRDKDLGEACRTMSQQTLRQRDWLKAHIEEAAPQALIAAH